MCPHTPSINYYPFRLLNVPAPCLHKRSKLSPLDNAMIHRPANAHLTFPSPRSISHTHLARPKATIATSPPGLTLSPAPVAPILLTMSVPPPHRSSAGVSTQGTCRPRYASCLSVVAMAYN